VFFEVEDKIGIKIKLIQTLESRFLQYTGLQLQHVCRVLVGKVANKIQETLHYKEYYQQEELKQETKKE
jgi:hypothetical protein